MEGYSLAAFLYFWADLMIQY